MAVIVNEIAGIKYDAIFESQVKGSIKKTSYTIESGAEVVDHTIVEPITYTVTAAVSNIVLGASVEGIAAGVLSNLTNSGIGAFVAGATSIAITPENRVGDTMIDLLDLFAQRRLCTIDTGEVILNNMILVSYSRRITPETQGALFVDLVLEELATTDLILNRASAPTQADLHNRDPSQTQATRALNKGKKSLKDLDTTIRDRVTTLANKLEGFF